MTLEGQVLNYLKRTPAFETSRKIAKAIGYKSHYKKLIPILKSLVGKGIIEFIPNIGYAGNPNASTYPKQKWKKLSSY